MLKPGHQALVWLEKMDISHSLSVSFLDVEVVATVEREASRDLPCVFSLLATSRADTMQALYIDMYGAGLVEVRPDQLELIHEVLLRMTAAVELEAAAD